MPLVRISLLRGKADGRKAGEVVYRTMVDTLNVPVKDNFQIITEHEPGALIYDPEYLDIARTDGFIAIQITLNEGRSVEMEGILQASRTKAAARARRASAGRVRKPGRSQKGELVVRQWHRSVRGVTCPM